MMLFAVLAAVAAADELSSPLYRVCVEAHSSYTAPSWSALDTFPYLRVEWETVHEATVRPLAVQNPSWMWGRPIEDSALLPDRFSLRTTAPISAGAVLYIDTDAVARPGAAVTVAEAAVRPNILRVHGDSVELELCPELRQAVASR